MKRLNLAVGLIFCSTSAVALTTVKPIQISTELSVNGIVVSSPRIVTLPGEKAEIVVGEIGEPEMVRMAVTMTPALAEGEEESVLLNMDLEHRSGERSIKASPQILAKIGSQALVNLDTEKDQVQLRIKATKVRSGQ